MDLENNIIMLHFRADMEAEKCTFSNLVRTLLTQHAELVLSHFSACGTTSKRAEPHSPRAELVRSNFYIWWSRRAIAARI